MRRFLAIAALLSALLMPTAARATSVVALVNLQPADIPHFVRTKDITQTAAQAAAAQHVPVAQLTRHGYLTNNDVEYAPIGGGKRAVAGIVGVASIVVAFRSNAEAHAAYMLGVPSIKQQLTVTTDAHVGQEATGGWLAIPEHGHLLYGWMFLWRRSNYMILTLVTANSGMVSQERTITFAQRVDARMRQTR